MADAPGARRVIRVGILCNGQRFPAWQADAIRTLASLDDVEISLLIVRDASGQASRLNQLRDPRRLLWTVFNKGYIERFSKASRPVDLSAELREVPEITCRTEPAGRFGERFTANDLHAIRAANLDVILRFSFGILKGEILAAARFGVWSFHHGDEREFRGRPPGFWELVEGQPVVGAILQRLTERLDGGVVLHRGYFKATPHSYRRTRDDALLGSAIWPSVVIRQILSGDTAGLLSSPSDTTAPLRSDPGNGVMLRFLLRQGAAFVRAQFVGFLRASKWTLGIADAPIHEFLKTVPPIRWINEQPGTRYLADPFAREHRGRIVTLVEDFDYATHRGVISAIDIFSNDRPKVVLDTGVHSSYPYLFSEGSDIYCVPETYQANEVRIYRAVEFPTSWQLFRTILKGFPALDSTVFSHDGRWWLFCTDQREGSNAKLHVFHASTIGGPWEPHRLNPVKTDIRSARPAGTPFVHAGHLYRPAQNNSVSYGGGITITRIDVLTPTRFAEEIVTSIDPPKGSHGHGIHTLSAAGNFTLVDGRRDTFVRPAARREFTSRLRKLRRVGPQA